MYVLVVVGCASIMHMCIQASVLLVLCFAKETILTSTLQLFLGIEISIYKSLLDLVIIPLSQNYFLFWIQHYLNVPLVIVFYRNIFTNLTNLLQGNYFSTQICTDAFYISKLNMSKRFKYLVGKFSKD
jgi:hypothetical protein